MLLHNFTVNIAEIHNFVSPKWFEKTVNLISSLHYYFSNGTEVHTISYGAPDHMLYNLQETITLFQQATTIYSVFNKQQTLYTTYISQKVRGTQNAILTKTLPSQITQLRFRKRKKRKDETLWGNKQTPESSNRVLATMSHGHTAEVVEIMMLDP